MLESIITFLKKIFGAEQKADKSKDTAKERLHLVLIQDRASVSADFLETMKQEIIDVIKKYIDIDENAIDVRLTNKTNEDGTNGAPALYANIPITNVKVNVIQKENTEENKTEQENQNTENIEEIKETENKTEEVTENKENEESNNEEEVPAQKEEIEKTN